MVKVQFYILDDLVAELKDEKITNLREQKVYREVPLFYSKPEGGKAEIVHTQGIVIVSAFKADEIKFYEDVVGMTEKVFIAHFEDEAKKLEDKVDARYLEIKNKLEEIKFKVRKGIYREL